MVRLYQDLPGIYTHPGRQGSRFWNEGKWENFIEPLLPDAPQDMTFVEMGCNAGLFLEYAEDRGFRHVVGVEKDVTPVKVGLEYRDRIGGHYAILKRTLGVNFDLDEIPCADVTLLSTVHYYFDIDAWLKYLDRLQGKTRLVIVVSRAVHRHYWKALSDYNDVRGYFRDWRLKGYIKGVPTEGDPSPRDLWSVLLENPRLGRVPVDQIRTEHDAMQDAMEDLARRVVAGQPFEVRDTPYWREWAARKAGLWKEHHLESFVAGKLAHMQDVKRRGLIDPLIVQRDGRLSDGGHRLAVLKALGQQTALVRWV